MSKKSKAPKAETAVKAPTFAEQADALPKGKRGQRRFTYPAPQQVIDAAVALADSGKQGTVAAYLAAQLAAGEPATYGGLHDVSGTAARNAWRKGWVTAA